MAIQLEKFGRDHWSLFAYIETRCVDYGGELNKLHMRCDQDRHPAHRHAGCREGVKYPTRLKGDEVQDHDDWDCANDLESAGLIQIGGTGLHPVFRLTKEGRRVAALLREHKANGGKFAAFSLIP